MEFTLSDKVTPISKGTKKKKKDDLSTAEYYRMICDHINGKVTALFDFRTDVTYPNRYYLTSSEDEERMLLIEYDHEVVKYCKPIKFKSDLALFLSEYLWNHHIFAHLTERGISDIYRYWEIYTETIHPPRSFKFFSEPGLCFSRMIFDPEPDDGTRCPLFSHLCSRIKTNERAFRAFIGSIFVPGSDRQQYLYIHGAGMNGKGTIIRFLEKCLGPAFSSREPQNKDRPSNFWNSGLLGKRLVAFSDCNQPDFPTSEKFKMLTGGDSIPIEKKGKDEYTSKIDCKFIFASNNQLEISGQLSDQRRAIYCDIDEKVVEYDPSYEDRLFMEAPYIIGWCLEEYYQLCPNNKQIPVDSDVLDDLAADVDSDIESVFVEYFNLKADAAVSSTEIQRIFKKEFGHRSEVKIRKFRKWMKYYHGLSFERITVKTANSPRQLRVLKGVALKEGNCYIYDKVGNHWKTVDSK